MNRERDRFQQILTNEGRRRSRVRCCGDAVTIYVLHEAFLIDADNVAHGCISLTSDELRSK